MSSEEKIMAGTLNNWYKQPLAGTVCVVWGELDHDERGRFWDGAHIHTSATPDIPMKEGDIIETRYSKYTLGTPEFE